jgi:hypothetical protein
MAERDILQARLSRRELLAIGGLGAIAVISNACGLGEEGAPETLQLKEEWERFGYKYAFFTQDAIYVRGGLFRDETETLFKLDPKTGQTIWRHPEHYRDPKWGLNGNIYSAGRIGGSFGSIGCGSRIDPDSGEDIWTNCDIDDNAILYENEVFKTNPEDGPSVYIDANTGEELKGYVHDETIPAVEDSIVTAEDLVITDQYRGRFESDLIERLYGDIVVKTEAYLQTTRSRVATAIPLLRIEGFSSPDSTTS